MTLVTAWNLDGVETGQPAGPVAKAFDVHAHAIHQAQMKIGKWRFAPENDAPAGAERSTAASDNHSRQVIVQVTIPVGESRTVNQH